MEIKIGERYKHYKGGEYTIITLAYREEDIEPVVVYQAEYDSTDLGPKPVFVRPVKSFREVVIIDGVRKVRFEKLDTE